MTLQKNSVILFRVRQKKITTGAKPATRGLRAGRHLVFNHPIHQQDRESAAQFRRLVPVAFVEDKAAKPPASFPEAAQIGKVLALGPSGWTELDKGAKVDEETGKMKVPEWDSFYKFILDSRAFYLKKRGKKKDGSPQYIKTPTRGVKDNTISLPIGWTKTFSENLKTGKLSARDVDESLEKISKQLMETQRQRTGWEPLYIAVHPDSERNFQFHFGMGSVDQETRQLLGRSATGKPGKQGLREAGFNFLNVWRHARKCKLTPEEELRFEEKFLKMPKLKFKGKNTNWDGSEKILHGGFDDVALAVRLEELLKQQFPHLALEAENRSVEAATTWARKALNNGTTPTELTANLEEMRGMNVSLEQQNQRLETKAKDAERAFGESYTNELKLEKKLKALNKNPFANKSEAEIKQIEEDLENVGKLRGLEELLMNYYAKEAQMVEEIQALKRNPFANKSETEIKALNEKLQTVDELRDENIRLKKFPLDGKTEGEVNVIIANYRQSLKKGS